MDLQVLQQTEKKSKRSVLIDPNDKLNVDLFQQIPENSQLYLQNTLNNSIKKLTDKEAKTLFKQNFENLQATISGIVKEAYDKESQEIISGIADKTKDIFDLNNYITYYSQLQNQSQLPINPKVGSTYSISGNLYIYSIQHQYLKLISKNNINNILQNEFCTKMYVYQKETELGNYLINYQNEISGKIQNLNNYAVSSFLTISQANDDKDYLCGQIQLNKQQYQESISYWQEKYSELSANYDAYAIRLASLQNQIETLSSIISGLNI